MTTDRNDDRLGAAVHEAYRPFALSEAQRRLHRERLAAAARRRGSDRLRSHLAELAAIAAVALIAIVSFLYWNSLAPGSNDDAAEAVASPKDVKCFSDLPNYSMPPEVQEQVAAQLATEGYVDCTTSPAIEPTPTDSDCVPLPDALRGDVPAVVTQQIREDTVYCPPEPTPPFTPSPTPLPTSQFAGQYGFYYGVCRATPYADEFPPIPPQAGFTDTWFGGELFGLWAGLDREMEGVWTTSSTVLWAPHDGQFSEEQGPLDITIEGRRLDSSSPPLETEVLPASEPPLDDDVPADERGAQALIEMRFPEPGCWEVVGWAGGDLLLSFVVEVVPEGESALAIRVRQHKEAIAAEREAAIPFPVPDTCAVDAWNGPEDRLLGRYPAEMVGGDDWTYSYFLDGGGLDLNARLGVLYEGTNTVFWVSIQGRLPGDAILTAEPLDGESTGEEFSIERTHSTYDVELSGGAQVTVERAEIVFPSSGCWQLRVESEDVSFNRTVYVYPPAGDRAEAARDHERLYTIDLDGRLHGIDLQTGGRFLSIFVGAYADVALSPDSLTLYAVSYDENSGPTIAAYDAITGEELWSAPREYPKMGYLGDGGPPTVAVSADGNTLYVLELDIQDDQRRRMVAAYDAASGQFVERAPSPEDNVFLSSCPASLWPSLADSRLLAVCKGGSNFITLDMDSGESSGSMGVPVSGENMETVGEVDGALAYVITGQGNVAIFDRETLEVTDRIELIDDGRPAWSGAALSPDGSRLYVALRSVETGAYFREVRVFDTATWDEADRFELAFEGFGRSMAVDSPGNLYGIEWLSTTRTQVWKRDAATGEVTVMLVADSEVHQLLLASGS
jgi:DNA-binding beta-propeller fold protein YncE